jgi:hypothetical protein
MLRLSIDPEIPYPPQFIVFRGSVKYEKLSPRAFRAVKSTSVFAPPNNTRRGHLISSYNWCRNYFEE